MRKFYFLRKGKQNIYFLFTQNRNVYNLLFHCLIGLHSSNSAVDFFLAVDSITVFLATAQNHKYFYVI